MKAKILAVIFLAAAISGCEKPKVDTSTDEAMKTSIAKVRESLPDEKKSAFDESLKIMMFSQIDIKDIFSGAAGAGNTEAKMKEALSGKTGEQIISEANQIKIEREKKEREQAIQEIKELEGKKLSAKEAKEKLALFQVTRSRFYKQPREYVGVQPIIELTVKNETGQPISRAYFEGTIASPGRSVPWMKDTFNYEISGGMEPGEEASWTLAPNMFSDWGKVEAPTDAVFTVVVTRLDGADGNKLFSANDFDESDEKRLTELKQKYGIQQ